MSKVLSRGKGATAALRPLTRLFKALADEHRLQILQLLHDRGELSVTVLSNELQQSQPAVSHHLVQLRNAGLIDFRRNGKFNYYRLDATGVLAIASEVGAVTPRLVFAGLELHITPAAVTTPA